MKQSLLIFAMICTLIVLSCSYGRNHPTKPKSEWRKDHAECEKIVRSAITRSPTGYDVPGHEINLTRECMKKKGWR